MKLKSKVLQLVAASLLVLAAFNLQLVTASAQNSVVTYQGRVTSNGTNFTGTGQFKFAIVTSTNNNHTATATATTSGGFITILNPVSGGNGYVSAPTVTISGGGGSGATATANLTGGAVTSYTVNTPGSGYNSTPTVTVAAPPQNLSFTTFWSNDGTSSAGSQPTAAVSAAATNGLFLVALGDTTLANMTVLPTSLFVQPNLQLRIWFNDGINGFAVLSPLQNLTPAPYAAFANSASNILGTVTASQLSGSIPVAQLSGTLGLNQLPTSLVTNNGTGLNLSGAFSGNGAGVTNLNLASVGPTGTFGQSFGLGVGGTINQVGGYGQNFAVADVNGDGSMDVVIPNYTGGTMTIMTNNGSGIFSSNATLTVGLNPIFVAAADLNNDGKVDLICVNSYNNFATGNSLTIYTNTGGGIFGSNTTFNVGNNPQTVVAADITGDGKLDLITGNGNGTLTLSVNNGSGGFVFGATWTIPNSSQITSLAAVDVNNDGKVDLVIPMLQTNTVMILTNSGGGFFGSNSVQVIGTAPYKIVATDINGDGRVDLIGANFGLGTLTVLTNNGSGSFGSNATINLAFQPYSLTAGDLKGDSRPDLIATAYNANQVSVLTNNGVGKFGTFATYNFGNFIISTAVADVNGDGKLDILANDYLNNSIIEIYNLSKAIAVGNGGVSAVNFFGSGAGLTSLNASQLTSGTVPDARLSQNVALLSAANYFYGNNTFSSALNEFQGDVFSGNNFNGGNFSGNGSALTSLSAANLTGTLPVGVLPATVETSGSTLRVGSAGTTFALVQAGQYTMPSSSTTETNVVITFPQVFSVTPKILISVANDPGFPNVNDIFAASISSNSPSAFRVNVMRLDTAGGWSQQLRINWQAWQ